MQGYLTRDQVRSLDRRATEEFGMPSLLLMENAGRHAADLLRQQDRLHRVVICCGKGNNGGDGLVMARHLDLAGIDVQVALLGGSDAFRGDAAVNCEIVGKSRIRMKENAQAWDQATLVKELDQADWIVDALFGTGLSAEVKAPISDFIQCLNQSGKPIFAVDVPSGLDCDTGLPLGIAVSARVTGTFVAPKVGFTHPEAQRWLGAMHVLDIGAPRRLVSEYLASKPTATHA